MNVTESVIGREVRCRGALCGTVAFVVWDPWSERMTFLVVRPEGHESDRLVPADRVTQTPDGIAFEGTLAEFHQLENADEEWFLRNTERDFGDRSDRVLIRAKPTT